MAENAFYTELAIDEEGPKQLLISESDGRYTISHDGKVLGTIKQTGENQWKQVGEETLSPGVVSLIGDTISQRHI